MQFNLDLVTAEKPPEDLQMLGGTEKYVEYDRMGRVVRGQVGVCVVCVCMWMCVGCLGGTEKYVEYDSMGRVVQGQKGVSRMCLWMCVVCGVWV